MDNSIILSDLTLMEIIKDLREKYKNNRIGKDVDEQMAGWANLKKVCESHQIDPSILYLGDDTLELMKFETIRKLYLKA